MVRVLLCILLMYAPVGFCDSPLQDTAQDQAKGDSNDKIQDNLQAVLSGDPVLSGADVQAQVDDQSITLTGSVTSYAQHQRVLQLVAPYTRTRQIIDKIKSPNPQSKYARATNNPMFWSRQNSPISVTPVLFVYNFASILKDLRGNHGKRRIIGQTGSQAGKRS